MKVGRGAKLVRAVAGFVVKKWLKIEKYTWSEQNKMKIGEGGRNWGAPPQKGGTVCCADKRCFAQTARHAQPRFTP